MKLFGRIMLGIGGGFEVLWGLLVLATQVINQSQGPGAFGAFLILLMGLAAVLGCIRGELGITERISLMLVNGIGALIFLIGSIAVLASLNSSNVPSPLPASIRPLVGGVLLLVVGLGPLTVFIGAPFLPRRDWKRKKKDMTDEERDQRKRERMISLGVGLPILLLSLPMALVALGRGGNINPTTPNSTNTTSPANWSGPTGPSQTFKELNFKWTAPDDSWIFLDPQKFNPEAQVFAKRSHPDIAALIIIEKVGLRVQLTTEGLREIAIANAKSSSTNVVELNTSTLTVDGVEGVTATYRGTIAGRRFHYINWLTSYNGFAVQVLSFGQEQDAAAANRVWSQVLAGFHFIDPDLIAYGDSSPAEDFRSERYGFEINLADQGWRTSKFFSDMIPHAEFVAEPPTLVGGLVVRAVRIDEHTLSLDEVARAMMSIINFSYPNDPDITSIETIESDDRTIQRIHALLDGSPGLDYEHIHDITLNDGCAIMLQGMWPKGDAEQKEIVLAALQQVMLFESMPLPTDIVAQLEPHQLSRRATFFNTLGLAAFERNEFSRAAVLFEEASQADPSYVTHLVNQLKALNQLSRYADGVAAIRATNNRFDAVESVVAWDAYMRWRSDDSDGAVATWRRLFATGYQNDEDVELFADALISLGRPDEAIVVIDNHAANPNLDGLVLSRVYALEEIGQINEGLTVLEPSLDAPVNIVLADRYVQLAYNHELHEQAIAGAERVEANGRPTLDTFNRKGLAQLALDQLEEAKASFEKALALKPGDQTLRGNLEYTQELIDQKQETKNPF